MKVTGNFSNEHCLRKHADCLCHLVWGTTTYRLIYYTLSFGHHPLDKQLTRDANIHTHNIQSHTHARTHAGRHARTHTHPQPDAEWPLTPHSTMTGLLNTLSQRRQKSFLLGGSTNTWISYECKQFQTYEQVTQLDWQHSSNFMQTDDPE